MKYDDIYGMTITDYCDAHGTTIEHLIQKVKIDIEILESRLKQEMNPESKGTFTEIGSEVWNMLSKKKKHLSRLQDWKNENEYEASSSK